MQNLKKFILTKKFISNLALLIAIFFFVFNNNLETVVAKTCQTPTPILVSQLFERWNASLQTGDPSAVAKNYAEDAILLPTTSNQIRHNRDEIAAYFAKFLTFHPVGEINERQIQIFCDVAVDSGIYTFKLKQNDKSSQNNIAKQNNQIRARYTFVYKYISENNYISENKWLIAVHHSSAMPEKSP